MPSPRRATPLLSTSSSVFRREDACKLIERCNDFGAGVLSAIPADGLDISGRRSKRKAALTVLAGNLESQERMAVALEARTLSSSAHTPAKIEATIVATVTEDPRLSVMRWRVQKDCQHQPRISPQTALLNHRAPCQTLLPLRPHGRSTTLDGSLVRDLNVASNKGLESVSTPPLARNAVLMPFGGARPATPCPLYGG